jgi:hypothetical protein
MSMLPPIIEPEALISLLDKYADLKLEIEKLQKENTKLRPKAEVYDKGKEAWVLFQYNGFMLHNTISYTEEEAWGKEMNGTLLTRRLLNDLGYTCRKVRVCKEVENE